MRLIGLIGSGTAAAQSQWTTAFVQHLRELGWTEGRNVTIEYRWAEGRSERFAEIAAEFVRRKVDLILTHNTPPTLAAKEATSTIPIVFATAGDPVGSGIVASLRQPGGNVTGLSSETPDTAGKKIELLRELISGLRQLAILSDIGNPFAAMEARKIGEAARPLGIEVAKFEVCQAADIDPAFEAFKGHAQALYVIAVPIMFTNRVRINSLALAARLPTLHGVREYVEAGGLMSYGPKLANHVAPSCRSGRQGSAWDKAIRHSCRAANKIRSDDQCDDCKVARPQHSAAATRHRRRGDRMRRREFIALLSGATAWPLAARGQQPDKIFKIGFIATGGVSLYMNAFHDELQAFGWIEGKNVIYEARYAENRLDRLPELVAELLRLNVDVIVAGGTPAPLAAKRALRLCCVELLQWMGKGAATSQSNPASRRSWAMRIAKRWRSSRTCRLSF